MIEFTPNQTANQLACNLKQIIRLFSRALFVVHTILMDMEFDKVVPYIPVVVINTSAASEHVAEVKRHISLYGSHAFQKNSKHHDYQLGAFLFFWLNATPVKPGITSIYSPRKINTIKR